MNTRIRKDEKIIVEFDIPCLLNHFWVNSNSEHYLAINANLYRGIMRERFITTCCEITAAALLQGWKVDAEKMSLLKVLDYSHPLYMLIFGKDFYWYHVLLVKNNIIYHSWTYHFELIKEVFSPERIEEIKEMIGPDVEVYMWIP